MSFNTDTTTNTTTTVPHHVVVDASSYASSASEVANVVHENEQKYFQDKQEKSDSQSGDQGGQKDHDLPIPDTLTEDQDPPEGNMLFLILALLGQIRQSQAQTAAVSGIANATMATEAATFGYSSAQLNKVSEMNSADKEIKGGEASIAQGNMGIVFGSIGIACSFVGAGMKATSKAASADNVANSGVGVPGATIGAGAKGAGALTESGAKVAGAAEESASAVAKTVTEAEKLADATKATNAGATSEGAVTKVAAETEKLADTATKTTNAGAGGASGPGSAPSTRWTQLKDKVGNFFGGLGNFAGRAIHKGEFWTGLGVSVGSLGSSIGSSQAGAITRDAARDLATEAAKQREVANLAQTTQAMANEAAQAYNQLQNSSQDCASKTVDAAAQMMQLGAGIARELKG